ncbi:cytochrome d ubiquinol oxidase subunit II [Thiohalorhabdus denitrificans]|uniref:Cytochrome d ubiquinol oxidase subunit II n=1 Tax=Thiohalorhabdus denitrificans TaxID=381306 RepID=A0A1G5HIY6_9GAMM|nr:cytochrome d ubiquinol oxidase subunit II [Thiohalorhabdus denitrificans]
MIELLPYIWFGVIGLGVIMYVLLDGFVLGIGIIMPFVDNEDDRDLMMNTAAPIWDGNETWLVLGGAGLLAAFPRAYSLVLSALYLPVILMLIALIFRGVSFEFRFKAGRSRWLWGVSFMVGSIVAAFAQGVILGAIVRGLPLENGQYAGGPLDWFAPFTVMTGFALVCGYALLGATWVILKAENGVQRLAFTFARPLAMLVIIFLVLVSVWMPVLHTQVLERWFTFPDALWLAPLPILVGVTSWLLWRSVQEGREVLPFLLSLALFGLGYIGLLIGIWPHIVPPDLSIEEAAAHPSSQGFTLIGLAILLPVILGYSAWSYWVFRGKVTRDTGYH